MKPIRHLLLLASLGAPALAQTDATPRVARSLPNQGVAKPVAAPDVVTPAAVREVGPGSAAGVSALPKLPDAATPRTVPTSRPTDRVYWTTQRDGTLWASGRTYKASFGADGATYVPFLGSQAPRNFPLATSLASATAGGAAIPLVDATGAVRDGDRVVVDRGAVDEVYELGLDSVEQTFVVAERPASGDLRFLVRIDSEMTRAEDADGFTYSNEHGAVRYGRAFVREVDGRRVPVASRLVEGGVEIVVDADYLAGASFPLVVDPLISTFATDTNGNDTWSSEIAYDLSTDRYLTVYEFNYNQTDGDVYAVLRQADGSQSYFAYLDNTTENWRGPKVANLNSANQFLMVAQASAILGAQNWNIWGMTIDATTLVAGWKTLISTTDQIGAKYMPDVGGDIYDGPGDSYYCVTWRRDFTVSDWDTHARLVRPNSTLVGAGTILVDDSSGTRDSQPSISKCAGWLGGAAAWTIAWQREIGSNYNIHAARLSWDGILLNGPSQVTSAAGLEHSARVSSPAADGRTLLLYSVPFGTDDDVAYALLDGTTIELAGSLTALDAPGTMTQDQVDFSVDTDGSRFVVAYAETYLSSSFDYDIRVSTFVPFNGALVVTDAHRALDYTSWQSRRTDVVAHHSGGVYSSPRFAITWDTTGAVQHDVLGAIYDRPAGGAYGPFCAGDGSSATCPCLNYGSTGSGCANSHHASGARLTAGGDAQSAGGDTMSFTVTEVPANVSCTLFQGTANSATTFGDGVRCVAGTQIRIRSKFANLAGNATWPTGAEPRVSVTGLVPAGGARRYYQVSYRNSAVFCTSATFNISNGLDVLWLP